jgi:hypothetical protein
MNAGVLCAYMAATYPPQCTLHPATRATPPAIQSFEFPCPHNIPCYYSQARFSFYGEASSSLKPYATSLVADCRTFTMHGNFYNWTASNDGCGVYFSPNRPSDLFVTTAPIVVRN